MSKNCSQNLRPKCWACFITTRWTTLLITRFKARRTSERSSQQRKLAMIESGIILILVTLHIWKETATMKSMRKTWKKQMKLFLKKHSTVGPKRSLSKSYSLNLVKEQMDHGEISGSIFDQVWTECYNEVKLEVLSASSWFVGVIPPNRQGRKGKIYPSIDGKQEE